MTTPQPAALPELPKPTKAGHLIASCPVYQDIEVKRIQREAFDAGQAYALAALQSQPAAAVVSDEPDLASKVVNDSCWKFVEAMPHQLPGPIWNDLKPALYAALMHYHRAILALRPQAVPMTEAWREVAACPDGDVWFSLSCGHVVMGWKQGHLLLDWEAAIDHDCCSDASAIKAMPVTPPVHHGITAQGAHGEQA